MAVLAPLLALLVGVPAPAGAAGTPFPATGYFSIGQLDGRSFFVTPTGQPFYSSGIDHVTPDPDTDQTTGQCPYCETIAKEYPTTNAWATATVSRLRSWGFNSLGAFSDYSLFGSMMPFSVQLSMASGDDWFTPSFVTHADEVAATEVAPLANDPNLIGWYTDSELDWGPSGTNFNPVLDTYLALPTGSPGHTVAEEYVGDPNGFLYALATRYFQVTTAAVRMYDPHHLILGVKAISQEIQPQLLEAASPYVNVFSLDDYQLKTGLAQLQQKAFPSYLPVTPTFANFEQYLHRPIMVGEYSFIASTPQTPDTVPGVYQVYPTQQARAAAYTDYAAPLYLDSPWVVGDEWFEYVDEPEGGRFDGENNNFGTVDVEDQPYHPLVTQMQIVHSIAPDRAVHPGPTCDSWSNATGTLSCTATMTNPTYPLSVFTSTLPSATEGSPYSHFVIATGGRPGYRYSLGPTQSLPTGLTLDPSSGLVSGTPQVTGRYSFNVHVTDSSTPSPQSASGPVTITVGPPPVAISSTSLPTAVVGSPYSTSLGAVGGNPPYLWSATGLPSGLTLSSTGTISGTPTAPGQATVRVTATDSSLPTAETAAKVLTLDVRLTSSLTVTATPPTAMSGQTVTYRAEVSGTSGPPTGTVAFSEGSALCTASLVSGSGACSATASGSGTQTVLGTYSGDATYTASTATTTVSVHTPPRKPQPGYWMADAGGGIFSFGSAGDEGALESSQLNSPIVGIAAAPTGGGYWEVASDGGVFAFGAAQFHGSMGGRPLDEPIVGIAAAPTGGGYWEVASDGGVFSFGSARFYGSMGGKPLDAGIVGIAAAPTGGGYWEVASDGGVFSFGKGIAFFGSMGGKALNKPIVGMAAAPTGGGYWEVASDGGVFAFGAAQFHGSMGGRPLDAPIMGLAADATGKGYWELASDGGVFSFGNAPFCGSMGGTTGHQPMVGMATVPSATGGLTG
ncbi:MAG TPA: putative Ig domain-containing protein [Acidimicrobiales bacterium]|nr:putative Ig domain-containing protein [Acidimicrobiales bacterium]